jgi:hypothetical protein
MARSRNLEAPRTVEAHVNHSGRDQEGCWNLGQRKCWLVTSFGIRSICNHGTAGYCVCCMHCGELREWNANYSGAGTAVTLAPKPFLIFSATLCLSIHFEHSAVSCWWRCRQNHLVSRDDGPGMSQSQRICEAISDACLNLSWLGLSTIPSLEIYPFKW